MNEYTPLHDLRTGDFVILCTPGSAATQVTVEADDGGTILTLDGGKEFSTETGECATGGYETLYIQAPSSFTAALFGGA